MTREDILRMAREAGVHAEYTPGMIPLLERFAALVAAAERNSWPAEMEAMERQVNILTDALAHAKAEEREACAKVCELHGSMARHSVWMAEECAALIRARGQA